MAEFYEVFRETLIETGQEDRLPMLEDHERHRGTVESVSALLNATGFAVEKTITDSFPMRFADGSSLLRHYFIRLGFLPGWSDIVAPGRVEETLVILERNLNKVAAVRGELQLTVPMVLVETQTMRSDCLENQARC